MRSVKFYEHCLRKRGFGGLLHPLAAPRRLPVPFRRAEPPPALPPLILVCWWSRSLYAPRSRQVSSNRRRGPLTLAARHISPAHVPYSVVKELPHAFSQRAVLVLYGGPPTHQWPGHGRGSRIPSLREPCHSLGIEAPIAIVGDGDEQTCPNSNRSWSSTRAICIRRPSLLSCRRSVSCEGFAE